MRLRLRSFLLTSALTFAPAVASATTISGLYVDGGSGYNNVQDQHVHANSTPNGDAVPKFSVNHGTGFAGFGAVGWGFGNGLRVEAEGLYNFSHDDYTSGGETTYTTTEERPYTTTEERPYKETQVIGALPQTFPEYQKGKDLWVRPWEGPYGPEPNVYNPSCESSGSCAGAHLTHDDITPPVGGGPYYITVQKVDEAPEWMTNPNYLLKSIKDWSGTDHTNGTLWYASFDAPGSTVVDNGKTTVIPDYDNASTTMTSCSDCYFVNILTQSQVIELEKGQLPNDTNIDEKDTSIAAEYEVERSIAQRYFPGGIYYIGDVYDNGKGTLPVKYEDGKLVYSATYAPRGTIDTAGMAPHTTTRTVTAYHDVTIHGYHDVSHNITRIAPYQHYGTDESWGGFANVLYDFDLERLFGLKSIATPFIGGGAGYLWQRYNRPNTMIAAITGTHGGFSWQGIAGVAFDTGISGLQVVAQYRMIGQPGSFYNGAFNYGTEGGHAHFDQRFNHQFIVGFRYAFQNRPIHHIQPPAVRPIVAAAPAPVPARSYLVFFDWNQYALTSRARQIVVEAAHATSYVHTTRINVNGYTDSSAAPGPAGQKYNYALSVKRARSVEAELIRNGVPASEIVIRGYGDSNPLVPTGPNTREPQNRRVEIILHA